MNSEKGIFNIFLLIFGMTMILGMLFFVLPHYNDNETKYKYIGVVTDIGGGSSGNVLILEINGDYNAPYTFSRNCINKVRTGQKVFEKKGTSSLWIEYKDGKYC